MFLSLTFLVGIPQLTLQGVIPLPHKERYKQKCECCCQMLNATQ